MGLPGFAMILLAAWGLSMAGTVSQTDWSSGPFTPGPVRDWADEFDSFSGLDYYTHPGTLSLKAGAEEIPIDDFDEAYCVHVADMDGDGDGDILGSGVEIAWWENLDGIGTSWQRHFVGTMVYIRSLDDADMNGDGHPDILTVSSYMDRASWWENPGDGDDAWAYHHIAACSGPAGSRPGDLDGDGDTDAAVAVSGGHEVAWWENTDGTGTDWMKHSLSTGLHYPGCIAAADIDGDGDIDISAPGPIAWLAWWENPQVGGGDWTQHLTACGVGDPSALECADLDGDGDTDLVARGSSGQIAWWENLDGTGTSWSQVFIATGLNYPDGLGAGDMDGDGDIDLASQGMAGSELGWWENLGGADSWEYHPVERYFNATGLHCGDLDGDGRAEIAGVYCYRDMLSWFDLFDGYAEAGSLTSSILYLGEDPDWGDIDWICDEPGGTSVSFRVRASDDYGDMGAWSDTILAPGSLQGLLGNGDSYLQYQVFMGTDDSTSTPSLESVTFEWVSVGIEETSSGLGEHDLLVRVQPDPVRGTAMARVSLPVGGMVSLAVFDLAGRMVGTTEPGFSETGEHRILLFELSPGLYFCRLRLGDSEAWDRFVVVR